MNNTLTMELLPHVYRDNDNREFVSNYTHDEAIAYCKQWDCINQKPYIANAIYSFENGGASDRLLRWVHILMLTHMHSLEVKAIATTPQIIDNGGAYSELYNILVDSLKAGKKNIRLFISTDFINFTLKYLNKNACVRVYEKSENPDEVYYGTITPQGVFCPAQELTVEIREVIDQIAQEPKKALKESGLITGICAYCGNKMKNEKAQKIGYGEKCAKNHGLKGWDKE